MEAVRAGLKQCYSDKNFADIILVGDRIPQNLLTEDEVLLQYYDIASSKVLKEQDLVGFDKLLDEYLVGFDIFRLKNLVEMAKMTIFAPKNREYGANDNCL